MTRHRKGAAARRNRVAFTLVELLVVVGVIVVLVAMLLPSLNRARAQAMAVQCQSNMRQLGLAFFNYATDNRDHIPPVGTSYNYWLDGTRGATFFHILGKAGYLGARERFNGPIFGYDQTRFGATRCPADNGSGATVQYGFWNNELKGGSYTMNWSITWYHYYLGYQWQHPEWA